MGTQHPLPPGASLSDLDPVGTHALLGPPYTPQTETTVGPLSHGCAQGKQSPK